MSVKEKLVELLKQMAKKEREHGGVTWYDVADYLIAHGVTVREWISVEDRLPDSGVHVLLCCEIRSGGTVYKRYVCDGYYAKKYTEQTWNNSGDIACEYHEEDDEYYLLEGWYEVIKNWDDYNSIAIDDFVTHWMPLPEPPAADMRGGK